MKPYVRITSHVNPPLVVTYTIQEFFDANADDMSDEEIARLVREYPTRIGGGAAPIVDVEPVLDVRGPSQKVGE